MNWGATTRALRTLSDLSMGLKNALDDADEPRGVLMIGAGVDRSLTKRPEWSALVSAIAKEAGLSPQAVRSLKYFDAHEAPLAAEALRLTLGVDAYRKAVRAAFRPLTIASTGLPMKAALSAVVERGVRLVITFNYSRDVSTALRNNVLPVCHLNDMAANEFPRFWRGTGGSNRLVRIVAMHGTVSDHHGDLEPIADLESYRAISGNTKHQAILDNVFGSCFVLSVGFSWTDPLVLSSAARVARGVGAPSAPHVVVVPRPKNEWVSRWRERAWVTAYGIRPVYYSNDDGKHACCPKVLNELAVLDAAHKKLEVLRESPTLLRQGSLDTVVKLARALEQTGDYEARVHKEFFSKAYDNARHMVSTCPAQLNEKGWYAYASIERHLRHHIWVYASFKERKRARREAWNRVAKAVPFEPADIDFSNSIGPGFDSTRRAVFEFALGAIELFEQPRRGSLAQPWIDALFASRDKGVVARATVGRLVWTGGTDTDRDGLRKSALNCGWESIEAKVTLDIAEDALKTAMSSPHVNSPRLLPATSSARISRLLENAIELANISGSERRKIGALVLRSLVTSISEAEVILIDALFGRQRIGDLAAPTTVWAVYVGLIAAFLDRRGTSDPKKAKGKAEEIAKSWLQERVGTLRKAPAGSDLGAAIYDFWKDFHAPAAVIARQLLDSKKL